MIGKPVLHPIRVTFDDKPETQVDVQNLPLPKRFGTYALVLVRDAKRQFLASVCRVPKPREDGTLENTPIFGEGQSINRDPARHAAIVTATTLRCELSSSSACRIIMQTVTIGV
ncbi:MAG TPA: hypothetical protein VM118_05750 [Acidobacteriota bacterium]|nr:hypothetical protein [Acidobacteriota bacterium]